MEEIGYIHYLGDDDGRIELVRLCEGSFLSVWIFDVSREEVHDLEDRDIRCVDDLRTLVVDLLTRGRITHYQAERWSDLLSR